MTDEEMEQFLSGSNGTAMLIAMLSDLVDRLENLERSFDMIHHKVDALLSIQPRQSGPNYPNQYNPQPFTITSSGNVDAKLINELYDKGILKN